MTEDTVDSYLPEGSWFRSWVRFYPRSEPPVSYKLFSAMAIMGAILGRQVYMDYDVHQIRPMLNLLLIGPSGIGKSTSVKMARNLLSNVVEERRPQFIEGGATREKLHQDLKTNPHAILFASELAAFFSKETYKEGLIPYVTNLLDYEDRIELRTRRDGITAVEFPEVTVMGGSTREWLQDMLPNSAVTGGFLARFLLLFEPARGKTVPNPHLGYRPGEKAATLALRRDALVQFEQLIHNAFTRSQGPTPIDYDDDGEEASDTYAYWYRGYQPESGLLSPFAARAGEMILRLSIILAVSCDRYCITREDILCAVKLYEFQAKRLSQIVVPVSQAGKLLATVLEAVPHDGTTEESIFRALRNIAPAQEVVKQMQSLLRSGDLEYDDKAKLPWSRSRRSV